ncbi:MAG: hypothetical protein AABY47_01685 [Pseudomonadota bacterium]
MKTTRMLSDEDFRQDECQDTKGISKIMRFILFVFFYFIGMTSAYADTSGGVPDTMAERVEPCTFCHGAEDTAGRVPITHALQASRRDICLISSVISGMDIATINRWLSCWKTCRMTTCGQ